MPLAESTAEVKNTYSHGSKLIFICIGLFMAALCVGLDRAIINTAVPKITTEFNSLSDIGWYGSAYLLTSSCFQLMYGKLYAEVNIKWLFLIAVTIFEVGSIVCAAAPSSLALIVGRAVAGLGSAGILVGAFTIIAQSVPLHELPKYTGTLAGAAGIAQMVGPTIGGVLTDKATWRWCFWINLPLGGITIATVFFLVHPPPRKDKKQKTIKHPLKQFDILGNIFFIPATVSLLLALEWGGGQYQWSNWRIILLLSIFSIFILVWLYIQHRQGDKATLPLRIIKMRSMACAVWFTFCISSLLYIFLAYVAVWFQTVRNVSAFQSGINFLAITVAQSVSVIMSGFFTSKIGYYVPQMITSTVVCSLASGLISRFSIATSNAYWICSLVLLGLGMGIGLQQPVMAAQTVLAGGDVAIGTSVVIFMITMSGTIFYSVGNSVLQDRLIHELSRRVPDVDPSVVVGAGANNLVDAMRKIYPQYVDGILASYEAALQRVFLISVILACLSAFGSFFIEWRSVKKDKTPKDASGDGETEGCEVVKDETGRGKTSSDVRGEASTSAP
ncbi:major facilitator superfamily transporter [Coniochaeta ligniaria NRRL 30616]|uniref:Major facilitator superfamily transporter n=1 Tax=Coniochaeta ligniaria NRRL 30616 TaxID=1408157 RepID=A0A1J7IMN6_9PEZI|nr:major facilitator superfamily transporter [Coniochaeta ligniaria NRRL 30616]